NHSGHEASDLLAVIRTADQKQKTWLLEKLTERVESDEKPAVRRACVVGLTAFGRNARRTLADVLMSDDDRNVRKLAAYALGQLGTKEEVDALVQAVRRDSGALGVGRDLAAVAVTALGEIGGEEAARALHEIWNSEQLSRGCREQTLTALGVAGHPGALPILQTVLQQSNQLLRDNAAFALGQLASRNQDDPAILSRSLTLLRQYLSDPNPRVRVNAVDALGRLGRPDDIALLEARSGDDYAIELSYTEDGQVKTKSVYPVRQKATEAIAQIRTRHNLTK
ncbi:MAG: HEAT repeat domain-containing protein, partial [Phycisphaerales bacterium]